MNNFTKGRPFTLRHERDKPKPDQSVLLTIDEETEARTEWHKLPEANRISWRDYWLSKQRGLTASIYQQEIEALIEEIGKLGKVKDFEYKDENGKAWMGFDLAIPLNKWQALKAKYTSKGDE